MASSADVRYLLRPRWLLSHLLVVLAVVAMVNLGFWQLRRLDERRERNDLIEQRQDQPVVAVETLLGPGDRDEAVEQARYRSVKAAGVYDADATVVVRNRTQDGVPGAWLVTPLVLANDDRVGIVRGFVGLDSNGDPQPAPPPEGEVTVSGAVVARGGFDGTAPRDIKPLLEEPDTLPGLVLAAKSAPKEPALLDPTASVPNPAGQLQPVPLPDLSEGPHLSYAVQWFIFATIGLVGYPLVLARVLRRRGKEVDDTSDLDRELEELLRSGG